MTVTEARVYADRVLDDGQFVSLYKEDDDGYTFFYGSPFIGIYVSKESGITKRCPMRLTDAFSPIPGVHRGQELYLG